LQLIIQVSLLSTLSPKIGALAIITAHSLGRLVPIYFMMAPAVPSHEGMGAAYSRAVRGRDVFASTLLTIVLLFGLIGAHLFIAAAIVAAVGFAFLVYVKKKIGGVLGDVLGASEQIAESFILLYFVVILTHSIWLSWLI
jgi:adenosylcobinamide-GDP ribazoletransferase